MSVIRSLKTVLKILQDQASRRWFNKALASAEDAEKIVECKQIIERQIEVFGVRNFHSESSVLLNERRSIR